MTNRKTVKIMSDLTRDELRMMHVDGFAYIFSATNSILVKMLWSTLLLVSVSLCLAFCC